MSDEPWDYVCGENADPKFTRVHRSPDGLIGRVRRTRLRRDGGSTVQISYFVWALPDSAPEYGTEEEARAHV